MPDATIHGPAAATSSGHPMPSAARCTAVITLSPPCRGQTGQRRQLSRDVHCRTTVRSRGLLNRRASRDRTDGPKLPAVKRGNEPHRRSRPCPAFGAANIDRSRPGSLARHHLRDSPGPNPRPPAQDRRPSVWVAWTPFRFCGRTSRSSDVPRWPAAGTDL